VDFIFSLTEQQQLFSVINKLGPVLEVIEVHPPIHISVPDIILFQKERALQSIAFRFCSESINMLLFIYLNINNDIAFEFS